MVVAHKPLWERGRLESDSWCEERHGVRFLCAPFGALNMNQKISYAEHERIYYCAVVCSDWTVFGDKAAATVNTGANTYLVQINKTGKLSLPFTYIGIDTEGRLILKRSDGKVLEESRRIAGLFKRITGVLKTDDAILGNYF